MELGFLPGNEIVLGRKAPGGGPRVYRVDGSEVALRQRDRRALVCAPRSGIGFNCAPMSSCHGDTPRAGLLPNPNIPPPRPPGERPIIVAIVGPPNSGKSTLFNRLTGLRQKVANFPGVTVEHRMGKAKLKSQQEVFLVDLPGVYSLTPRAEDEQVTHDVLKGHAPDFPKPDAVILILDVTNLGRNLVLAAPILSLGLPTLILLNMADDLAARGGKVDIAALASELKSPVALISAAKGTGIESIQQFLLGTAARLNAPPVRVELPVLQRCAGMPQMGGESRQTRFLSPARSADLDAPARWGFSAPCGRAADFRGHRDCGVPKHFFLGEADHGFPAERRFNRPAYG